MTRINARLDDEAAADLELIRARTAHGSVTEAVRYSLREVADRLRRDDVSGESMRTFLASDYVGCGEGPGDVSERYKDVLETGWRDKHGPG